MIEWLDRFLAVRGLAPHGYCLLWDPTLVWTHVVADALIALAYFSIPVVLWRLRALRRDVQFGWLLALFAVFILACGLTHVMGILTLWVPAYGWQALVKVITAMASLATAAVLVPLLPRLVAIPSPAALQAANAALLAEAAEREKAEAMLRQSQKMEAIGQLTGGLAHDFNNLLAVVIGNLDRARRKGPGTEAGARALDHALESAERAARLTDQLLAFARQQPLLPRPHDVNAIVTDLAPLFEQTVGEQIAIRVELDRQCRSAVVDRNQLENAIFNLVINARDAMAGSGTGTLTISTRMAEGGMLELAVRDTGSGMDEQTLERATDPFYTTKPVGKGSGLGLSQVLGTVQQLGGRLDIASAPGTGTTVRMFLPVEREPDTARDERNGDYHPAG
jgi:signal transduction histidine kinase